MELRKLIKTTVKELEEVAKENDMQTNTNNTTDEKEFLEFIRSRTEVLFLGLQAKEITNLDDKLEMTLKYLEFLLAKVEERLEKLT